MKTINRTSRFRAALFLLFAGIQVGCAKDQTVEDWRRAKVKEEFSQIQQVSGIYFGKLRLANGGQDLGEVEFALDADTRLSAQNQVTGAERQAVLSGRFAVISDRPRLLSFQAGSFDSGDGSFKAESQISDASGKSLAVSFTGVILGDSLEGRVEVAGQMDSAAIFQLRRGSPDQARLGELVTLPKATRPGQGPLIPPALPKGEELVLPFAGSATWVSNRETHSVEVLVRKKPSTSDQEFLDLLNPVQSVDVTINMNFGSPQAPQVTSVFFQNAQWDTRLGVIRGNFTGGGTGSGDRFLLSLICAVTQQELQCDYLSASQGRIFSLKARARKPGVN